MKPYKYYSPFILIILLILSGCASVPHTSGGNYKERVLAGTGTQVFESMEVSFKDAKYAFEKENSELGVIETYWKVESNFLAGLFIGRLHTKIKAEMKKVDEIHYRVHVDILLEKEVKPGVWESVNLVKESDYGDLFNGIEENLKTLQTKKP